MEKTGILGGTFDPVHNAHLMIAREAQAAAGLDSVLFMPAGIPPNKAGSPMAAPEHRLAMVRLAIRGKRGFAVSDREIKSPNVDYTADTLLALHEDKPGSRLYFIAGGDSLLYLDKWHKPAQLLSLAVFVAVYRPGSSLAELEHKRKEIMARFGGEILLVPCAGMDISSTEIRRRVAAGLDISSLVPKPVEAYIKLYGLYKESA